MEYQVIWYNHLAMIFVVLSRKDHDGGGLWDKPRVDTQASVMAKVIKGRKGQG